MSKPKQNKLAAIGNPQILILLLIELILLALFGFLSPSFLQMQTLNSMAFQLAELGLLTLAMVFPLITGGINLATIVTANASGLIMATMVNHLTPSFGSLLVALLAGATLSILIGAIIGYIVAYLKVHPILVTLGMMTLLKGAGLYTTNGKAISGFPAYVQTIGNGSSLGLPNSIWILLLVSIILLFICKKTSFGTSLYMLGSNINATEYSGINTKKILVCCYIISSLLCCLAGLVMMSRFNSARIDYGESYLLLSVLIAVLGGINPMGGRGGILGVLIALLVLQTTASGLNSLRFSTHFSMAFNGIILLLVLLIARMRSQKTH